MSAIVYFVVLMVSLLSVLLRFAAFEYPHWYFQTLLTDIEVKDLKNK